MRSFVYISPDGEYPRHPGDIQLVYPEWDYMTDDPPEGWIEVVLTDKPAGNLNEMAREAHPQEIDGVWTQVWEMVPTPPPPPTLESLAAVVEALLLAELEA